jgi:hypothetical protein
VLDGFVVPDRDLDRYQRGFYQLSLQVASAKTGGSEVRAAAKITAWYADPASSHSGYRVLVSNGRLDTDALDQLGESLGVTGSSAPATAAPVEVRANKRAIAKDPPPVATSNDSKAQTAFSSSLEEGLSPEERMALHAATRRPDTALESEVQSLSEVLKNQSHPDYLVAVKASGTPVFSAPELNGKAQFYASEHDEFEILDFNAVWVHVRISGLSRGWVLRNSVEMPEGFAATDHPESSSAPTEFHVTREETAPFPADWAPLRGKIVKIISVQKVDEAVNDSGPVARLEYTKTLLDKNYASLTKNAQDLAGIVLIFEAVDGGMIGIPVETLKKWESGDLSEADLWKQCFLTLPNSSIRPVRQPPVSTPDSASQCFTAWRADPFERGPSSFLYDDWRASRVFTTCSSHRVRPPCRLPRAWGS